jgi:hypothetical protein
MERRAPEGARRVIVLTVRGTAQGDTQAHANDEGNQGDNNDGCKFNLDHIASSHADDSILTTESIGQHTTFPLWE